ncbi:4-hydroxyacetophenone monooxygenase [Paraconexibacter sp. AEG42_29]|uniref:4-hydroxyacetophenone monooxygenase n=1 Tax=Paraconexibacter sp. AEG42_29 TaxID=2997339 RepID=A0AAU7B054_9ACTN
MDSSTPATLDPATTDLREALEDANIPTLLLVLTHLTGDERWLDEPYRPKPARGGGDNDTGGHPKALQDEIRNKVVEVVTAVRGGQLAPAADPSSAQVARWLTHAMATPVPDEAGGLLLDEMGITDRRVQVPDTPAARALDVLVIGSGFSGIAAAIELEAAGIPYTVLEKNDALGGTWLENTYPGCGVDTPSHFYSFSFAARPDWPQYFAKQHELRAYLERVAAEHHVAEHIRYGVEVDAASWDEGSQRWTVTVRTQDGSVEELHPRMVLSAVGLMNRPAYPRIPGIETFAGPAFHTAEWREDVDLAGKRVVVLGTGASAMQLVPALAGTPSRLTVFQRSPQWAVPNANYKREVPGGVIRAMADVPNYASWYRAQLVWTYGERLHAALQIDREWPHPERSINRISESHRKFLTSYIQAELGEHWDELREKCLPTYPPYGKRPLIDNGWFRAVSRDDVDLVTDHVVEIRPEGVVTADGTLYPADVLVFATGFQTLNMLGSITVTGRSGATLRDTWGEDDARAYLGITVPDFPNFFMLFGPNTNAGHGGSHVMSVEIQVRYLMDLLRQVAERETTSFECRQDVHDAYNERLDEALSRTIWTHPGMTTYYRNSKGRIVANMPWTNAQYWAMARQADIGDYVLRTES